MTGRGMVSVDGAGRGEVSGLKPITFCGGLSDEKFSCLDDQSQMNSKKSYVPRRLLSGNDRYVRIGNGNQLVRDPKRKPRGRREVTSLNPITFCSRLSDEKVSCLDDQSEKNLKKSYVPRRLLIGNSEYVRIGNGNQLVRDPKTRPRGRREDAGMNPITSCSRLPDEKVSCLDNQSEMNSKKSYVPRRFLIRKDEYVRIGNGNQLVRDPKRKPRGRREIAGLNPITFCSRLSDQKLSCLDDQSEMNSKKSYVPRRLLIRNDRYVRIGNGNQLVRDPKRRLRVLANEKVRWSLRTARLQLARKKYCQFFTRFGKCDKDDKKCPYIHDPSKIAVCTKFLNGSCLDTNCKLTHKVIPERMQDCSYFLQGVCSNESCPYRHVNVNPKSPICEGFLRGYCADGNECRKKHTYVCPAFEATGICEQVANCKLHHPKNEKKGMKRKASVLQKNARLRYFGARPAEVGSSETVSKIISGEGDESIFCQDGKFADYISLDVSDKVVEQAVEPRVEPMCDSEGPPDIADLDELIKPIHIMKKRKIIGLAPAIESSSEISTS